MNKYNLPSKEAVFSAFKEEEIRRKIAVDFAISEIIKIISTEMNSGRAAQISACGWMDVVVAIDRENHNHVKSPNRIATDISIDFEEVFNKVVSRLNEDSADFVFGEGNYPPPFCVNVRVSFKKQTPKHLVPAEPVGFFARIFGFKK